MAAPNIETRTTVGAYGAEGEYFITISPTAVGANTTVEQTFSLPGVELARDVLTGVTKPTAQTGLSVGNGRVVSDNLIGIQFTNASAGSITPTAGEVYGISIMRQPLPRFNVI